MKKLITVLLATMFLIAGSAYGGSNVKVILKPSGCGSYFLADGDSYGIYLLEWYGGYDPDVGDSIVGEIKGYGFKDVFYPDKNSKNLTLNNFLI